MSHPHPTFARNLRALALASLLIGWVASCGPGGAGSSDGSTVDAFGRKIMAPPSRNHYGSLDPAWGAIMLPSPSPGDANPLRIHQDGPELVYTFDPAPGANVQTVTYISKRTTGQASPGASGAPVDVHASPINLDDTVQQESQAPGNRFEVRVGYQRFYHGDYHVDAFVNRAQEPIAALNFSVN